MVLSHVLTLEGLPHVDGMLVGFVTHSLLTQPGEEFTLRRQLAFIKLLHAVHVLIRIDAFPLEQLMMLEGGGEVEGVIRGVAHQLVEGGAEELVAVDEPVGHKQYRDYVIVCVNVGTIPHKNT